MLATGPDMAATEMVKCVRERWNVRCWAGGRACDKVFSASASVSLCPLSFFLTQEPVVVFTDNIADRMALEHADLGCCMYTATGGLLQVRDGAACAPVSFSLLLCFPFFFSPAPCKLPLSILTSCSLPTPARQAAHAVLGSHGLERLVLYLKVLKESTEVDS